MKIPNDVKVTPFHMLGTRFAVACVQVDAHLVQIADDLKVAILARPAECFIVACLQGSAALM